MLTDLDGADLAVAAFLAGAGAALAGVDFFTATGLLAWAVFGVAAEGLAAALAGVAFLAVGATAFLAGAAVLGVAATAVGLATALAGAAAGLASTAFLAAGLVALLAGAAAFLAGSLLVAAGFFAVAIVRLQRGVAKNASMLRPAIRCRSDSLHHESRHCGRWNPSGH